MKSRYKVLHSLLIFSFCLCMNCKKNNINNPPGAGSHPGCLISTKTVFSPNNPNFIERDSIEYNSAGQFAGYHQGAVYSGGISYGNHYAIKYTSDGKIDSIIYFQGNLVGGKYKVFYNNNFVSAVIGLTGFPDTANFDWNAQGQNEMDAATYSVSSGCVVSSSTLFFNYQAASAELLDMQSEAGTSCAVKNSVDDLFSVFSTQSQSSEIKNPFRDSTTHEQQFLYYYLRVMDPLIVLSTDWPLAVYEGYSYASGQKVPSDHFYFNYHTDDNHRVTSAAYYTASDYPAFSYFSLNDSTQFTYLCK